MRDYFHKNDSIYFEFPIDGDCINERDGKRADNGGVTFVATVCAPENSEVYINGKRAEYAEGAYRTEVTLCGYRSTLTAEDKTNGTECKIAVYYMPDAVGKYRVSSDDNILFLQDITKNKDVYTSIFDNPYLAMYKQAHDLYGAHVHLNLFYEFDPATEYFSDTSREYFNLSMMTDKFKDEFRKNSDWLKLAFHSKREHPDMPYKNASGEQITEDCLQIYREIIRFAGKECINNTTTVHWGEATIDGVRALRTLGFRSLTGYFEMWNGTPAVAYYTQGELCEHIGARDFWYDTEEDMLFGRIDAVLNSNTLEWVKDRVASVVADPQRGGFVSVMIHEQYFHKDYCCYLPDFCERVLSICKYLYEHGYQGAHIAEVTKEPQLREKIM